MTEPDQILADAVKQVVLDITATGHVPVVIISVRLEKDNNTIRVDTLTSGATLEGTRRFLRTAADKLEPDPFHTTETQ